MKQQKFRRQLGSLTKAVLTKKWIATDDPKLYASREFTAEEESIIEQVKAKGELFMIELSYVSEDMGPQCISVITSDGVKFEIHEDNENKQQK